MIPGPIRVLRNLAPLALVLFWMPASHVVSVSVQVRSRPEVVVVKLQLQMMRLQVGQHEDARDGAGKLTEALVDVLCHDRHALLELLAVDLRARAHLGALLPGTWSVGVEWSSSAELALYKGFNSSPHVEVVWRAVSLEDPGEARRVRQRPALVGVVAKPQPRHLGVPAGTKNSVAVDAVEHPASQAHRLQHQHARVAAGRELRGALSDRVRLGEGQRQGLVQVRQVREAFETRYSLPVDVIVDHVAVL